MISRKLTLVAALAAIVVLVVAAGASGRAKTTVDVGDDFFDPKKVKIDKKDTIKFNWIGVNEHDIVKIKGPGKFFESGPITGSGIEYKRKFTKAGDYKLICTLHEKMTMKVEVD